MNKTENNLFYMLIIFIVLSFVFENLFTIATIKNKQLSEVDTGHTTIVELTPTPTPTIEYVTAPITTIVYEHPEVETSNEALKNLELSISRQRRIETIQINFLALGYTDAEIKQWYDNAQTSIQEDITYWEDKYSELLDAEEQAYWNEKMEQYPNATYIWLYLRECGYNDYVIAGILGNMMTECGGQSLCLNPYTYSGSYYGICQWNSTFGASGMSLEAQCQLLVNTIATEFNSYGVISYEEFCNLQNEQTAALAFARSYERCGSFSYGVRERNATIALNFFCS